MTALEKSRETRSGSFAIQYLYAVGSPSPASMAMTGGHRTTTRRSPRPAGPNARAPTRLEIIVDRSIVESVMKMSFALRAITVYSLKLRSGRAGLTRAAREHDRGYSAQQDRCVESQRPVIDVFEVELHPLFKREVAASRYLPETG